MILYSQTLSIVFFCFIVIVPRQALVLDWVFADGPPESARVYDNNKSQDFHAIVPQSMPLESYWADEENELFEKLQDERRQREEALRAKVSANFGTILSADMFYYLLGIVEEYDII